MDRSQFEEFCKNLYMEGYKDGRDSVPGIDIKQVEQAISETKGIGESRLRSIMNSIEKSLEGWKMVGRVYRGEIYYIHEAEGTGSEQTGGRPGIIISNDIGNEHSPVVIIVYLTTQEKKTLPTHVKINTATRPSVALCEQIETIYKGRIGNYIGQITDTEQKNIDKALAVSIGIGIATKSGKFLETWAKAYTEEFSSSMAEALESVVSELEFEKQEEVMVEPEQNNRSEIHEEMIRLETERNIYKELYMNLLSDLSGGKQS